jgi:hypothetical protein
VCAGAGDFELLLDLRATQQSGVARREFPILIDAAARRNPPELAIGRTSARRRLRRKSGVDRFADVADFDYLFAVETAYAASRQRADTRACGETWFAPCARRAGRPTQAREDPGDHPADVGPNAKASVKAELTNVPRGADRIVARDFSSGEEVVIARPQAFTGRESRPQVQAFRPST